MPIIRYLIRVWDETIDALGNLLRTSKGEYGEKKSEPDQAVGQFPAGELHKTDARHPRHSPPRRSVAPPRQVQK